MPPKDYRDKRDKKRAKKSHSDDDSSVDSKGNVRDLIDYDYTDESSVPSENIFVMEGVRKTKKSFDERPRRAAAIAAKKRLRRIADLPSESSTSPNNTPKERRQKPTLVIRDVEEDKHKTTKRNSRRVVEDSESEEEPRKTKRKPSHVVEDSESEEEPRKTKRKPSRVVEDSGSEEEPRKAKRKPSRIVQESEEEEEPRKNKKRRSRRVIEEESEEEEEEADFTTEESEEPDLSSDEDDDDEEDEAKPRQNIDIVISDLFGGGGGRDPNKPQKYNMKKEPQNVRRFVELVQKEDDGEEDTIDNDITYFKSLDDKKQSNLLQVLENKASPVEVVVPIKFKILEKVAAKPELNRIAMAKYNALCNIDPSSSEYYKVSHWITGFTNIPLGVFKDLPVKLEDGAEKCHEFMSTVHKCMDSAIYGHDEAKLQIMQFVSSWIANPQANGNVLSIHGPMGTGKTTLIKDGVAKALGRPFHFITLGGATDASFLDGHSYTYEGSTWGKIVDVLQQSKCMNPILYFDELDKVSETAKGDEIMNLLIHLTDGSQNDRFQDKYFTGIDLDLSRCLFIFSHNNHEKVNPILRDRMYNIAVKGFSIKEKLLIAENYLLQAALKDVGLFEKVSISKDILQYVVENFTGGEGGVRELKRCIQTIVSKLNLLRFYNNPKQVPFTIENFSLPFILQKKHVDMFLKKKEETDPSIAHLYT